MPIETERKFLTNSKLLKVLATSKGTKIMQGYVYSSPQKTIRIRVAENKGYITLKGESKGFSRPEFEYEVPANEAVEMLNIFAHNVIEKVRYKIEHTGNTWEVDVFEGKNKGLVIAEIELNNEDEKFEIPNWVENEVTGNKKYYNSYLAQKPFCEWENE